MKRQRYTKEFKAELVAAYREAILAIDEFKARRGDPRYDALVGE